jgi:nucleotide-binding universal stress UspA family protein
VVVGVDGSDSSLLALGFAVERAAQRGVPLHVVRVWEPPAARWRPPGFDPDEATATERAALEEPLEQWRRTFPNVETTVEVAAGNPASTLVEASRDAQLVVIGTRGRAPGGCCSARSASSSSTRPLPVADV